MKHWWDKLPPDWKWLRKSSKVRCQEKKRDCTRWERKVVLVLGKDQEKFLRMFLFAHEP